MLRLSVLDTQNNPVSVPSSTNIGEFEMANISWNGECFVSSFMGYETEYTESLFRSAN
jgi:hypothetical protein